ncbi:glycerol kinase [Rhodoligotrophos appendicifer]|uniref:glycerol kinase GlpK n=1 Tax=Rhodoligotrophos appendicifer TaxID=987056 RepID=UPI00117CA9DB|nr:glycerol kinase GlpK [Rhodoligotrophos appendicifer]
MTGIILALDQGTTSSRAMLFDASLTVLALDQEEFPQHFPASGWVEHDPEDLWRTTLNTARRALEKARLSARDIAAIGIANQRETVIVWERHSGKPIHNAIVWQDRRTADVCAKLREDGAEPLITARTGLLSDPYFSGTKIAWILDHVPGARAAAEAGQLACGTVDCFLLWRLTGGRVHATDATNASRTLLYDIHRGAWDEELLRLLRVPAALLPEVMDCATRFGETEADLLGGSIAVCGIAGDQQAATIGQACFEPGMVKSTYGTGCFAVLNTGRSAVASQNKLLTTIAYRLDGRTTYALEGSIFVAGAAVQWLRDALKVIETADQSGDLADTADPGQDVILVPAFTGLGAPHWDPEARGALFGLTRATGPRELARAALEAVCFQTRDLIEAMRKDWRDGSQTMLRVDGGMVASSWTMQRLADMLDAPVDRPMILETTALGAAWLAGRSAGVWPDEEGFSRLWRLEKRFLPQMSAESRDVKLQAWSRAIARLRYQPG